MVRRKMLSEEVADMIASLVNTKYFPGDKIPNESELAKEFGVSRTTIREAIKLLCSKNVLQIHRGKGTFVCENPGLQKDPYGLKYIKDDDIYYQFFETALLTEPSFAALAAQKATQEQIEKLSARHQEFVADVDKYHNNDVPIEVLQKHDIFFHKGILTCCNNVIIARIKPFIELIIEDPTETFIKSISSSIKYHGLIIDAIKEKNAVDAHRYMKDHLNDLVKIAVSTGLLQVEPKYPLPNIDSKE